MVSNERNYFAVSSLRVKFGDLTHAELHSVHGATTKYFSNSFVFKNKIEKEGLPSDRTPDLGAGAPGSNPGARVFSSLQSPPPCLAALRYHLDLSWASRIARASFMTLYFSMLSLLRLLIARPILK